jgi:hypothetical protein
LRLPELSEGELHADIVELFGFLAILLISPALELSLAKFLDDFSLFGGFGERGAGLVDFALNQSHFLHEGDGFALDRAGEAAMGGEEGEIELAGEAAVAKIGDGGAGKLVEIGEFGFEGVHLGEDGGEGALFFFFDVFSMLQDAGEFEVEGWHGVSRASYAPTGLVILFARFPRFAPWAMVFRPYAGFGAG